MLFKMMFTCKNFGALAICMYIFTSGCFIMPIKATFKNKLFITFNTQIMWRDKELCH